MLARRHVLVFLVVLFTVLTVLGACKKKDVPSSPGASAPPPTVTDDTTGLIFMWLDEKGEFHTGEKVSDVPMVGRDQVRVMDPEHDDGSDPDHIFIVDLRTAGEGGKYPTRVMKRADYDALAENLRKKAGPTLSQGAARPEPPPNQGAQGGQPGAALGTVDPSIARPAVIVYGASWCSACHEAMAYMKKKGISFVDKDIEKDADAAREMQAKLAKAGIRSSSIPILDVRGKILVGFRRDLLDQALGAPL
jgi:glutaredoxin